MPSLPWPMRYHPAPDFVRRASAFGICWVLGTSVLGAQQIAGKAVDGSGSAPISGARVELVAGKKTVATTTTDSAGRFILTAPRGGTYRLRATRLGYSETMVPKLEIQDSETLDIEVLMAINAVPLEPLRVIARARTPSRYLNAVGFYDREKQGLGSFLTRFDIEKRGGGPVSEVLRSTNGIRLIRDRTGRRSDVRMRNVRCAPAIYLDGAMARVGGLPRGSDLPIDDLVVSMDIDGIEVYNGPSETPPEFNRDSPCGVIAIWTRRRH